MESESESDINDREDYYINQQNRSELIQREATAFVVCNGKYRIKLKQA